MVPGRASMASINEGLSLVAECAERSHLPGSIRRVTRPTWAVVTLMRIGDSTLADSFFSRDTLARVDVLRVDMWNDQYIKVLREVQSVVAKTDPLEGHNLALRIAQVVPEILSRLCVKSSLDRRNEVFALLRELYSHPEPRKYPGTAHLTGRLLGSLPLHYGSRRDRMGFLRTLHSTYRTS